MSQSELDAFELGERVAGWYWLEHEQQARVAFLLTRQPSRIGASR